VTSVLRGAMLTVAMRWGSRLIGIVSTVILARLLMPDDFGVTAMASMVIGLVSVLLDLGVNVSLIRNRDVTLEHYQAAWTLRLAQAISISALLLVIAPFAGDYFRDHRVVYVLMVLALNVTVGSLENIGVISFQKNMQFGLEFRYLLTNRIFGFVCTVAAALTLRNYWALVLASLASSLFAVVNSYRVHPMRPAVSFGKLREILSVSQWMLAQNIGNYLDETLHKLVVGHREDAGTMGAYSLATEIAAMPSTELLQPLNRVLFPAFVAASHDLVKLKQTFLLAQSVQVLIALPAAVFMSLLADPIVDVMLGPKWTAAVPLLRALALASAIQAVKASAWYVSLTLGRERNSAAISWMQVTLFAALCFMVFPGARALQIAQLRVCVPAVGLCFQLWVVSKALGNLTFVELIAGLWRSIAAVAVTVVLFFYFFPNRIGDSALLTLLFGGAFCIVTYVACLVVFRLATGRLGLAEGYIVSRISPLVREVVRRG
jgi:O-antigen/teichoic acid export membrane protein